MQGKKAKTDENEDTPPRADANFDKARPPSRHASRVPAMTSVALSSSDNTSALVDCSVATSMTLLINSSLSCRRM